MLLQYFVIFRHSQLPLQRNTLQSPLQAENAVPYQQYTKLQESKKTASVISNSSAVTLNRTGLIGKAGIEPDSALLFKNFKNQNKSSETILSPHVLISGSVSDVNGDPIAGVQIKPNGRPSGVQTDSFGRYKMSVARSGKTYPFLVFLRSGYKKKMIRISKIDPHFTDKISVDVRMALSPETVTVNGWLGETNGTGIPGEIINLSSLTEGLYYSTRSDATGNFSFEGIKRGVSYSVDVKASEKYKNNPIENITITDHGIPVFITLEPISLVNIDGVVIDSYGGSVKNLKFKIRSDINSIYDTQLTSDEHGRFFLPGFPLGKLSFTTESPLFFKVSGVDLSKSRHANLVIPVDVGPHQISGWIRNQYGMPLKAARVVLDAQFKFNGLDSISIRTYVTDESGYFEFSRLGPGEHYVTVYARGFINQGVSYDTSARIDPLYIQLSQWGDTLLSSKSIKSN